jgi:hypothetical protein
MMIVHESGHVLAAWASGGRVARVILHPFAFSRTDLAENPHPLFVAWGGPVLGSVLPLTVWLIVRAVRFRLAFLLRFFAGFCLIANGAYLASAAAIPVGDSEELLRLGVPLWAIMAPGISAFAGGLALWNRLGSSFGFGGHPVDRAAVIAASVSLVVVVVGMLVGSRLTSHAHMDVAQADAGTATVNPAEGGSTFRRLTNGTAV